MTVCVVPVETSAAKHGSETSCRPHRRPVRTHSHHWSATSSPKHRSNLKSEPVRRAQPSAEAEAGFIRSHVNAGIRVVWAPPAEQMMLQPVFECRQVGFVKLVLTMRHSSALRALLSWHVQVSLLVVHVSLQQHFKHHRQQLFKVLILQLLPSWVVFYFV